VPGGIRRDVAEDRQLGNEKSREEELLWEGTFLIGQGKASLRMRAICPRAEVGFSSSSFLNSNLLGFYFFHLGAVKHEKTAKCGPGIVVHSQPAEHPVSR